MAIAREVQALAERRRLGDCVSVSLGCAGGCTGTGPNVDVTIYAMPRPGERSDHVAVGRKTYVYTLPTLDCLARVIDENLTGRPIPRGAATRGTR